LRADCVDLIVRLNKNQRRPMRISRAACAICAGDIESGKGGSDSLVSFFCGHSYHARCLKAAMQHSQSTALAASSDSPLPPEQRQKMKERELLGQKGSMSADPVAEGENLWCTLCHNPQAQKAD